MSAADNGQPGPRSGLFERLRAMFGFESATPREDVQDAIDEATREGGFGEKETLILKNALSLHELRVDDIMVPRADIVAVDLTQSLREILTVFRTASHSRLPVYHETLDDPRGMVHILDFVDYLARQAEHRRPRSPEGGDAPAPPQATVRVALDLTQPLSQANILRPVLFAPHSMPALDLLVRMQASHTHMALVVDEYGGTDGLVSIEDIMETIVGDIEDEHDEEEAHAIEAGPDGALTMSARAPLDAVEEKLGEPLADEESRDGVDTIGGLVASVAGRLPARGEIVRLSPTIEAEIVDADPRMIKRLRLRRVVAPPVDEEGG
jgi:CBS domain containing-hemolysin-like protein